MAVVVGFHCDVISCELARRGERPAAAVKSSACGCGNMVGLTFILDRVHVFLFIIRLKIILFFL